MNPIATSVFLFILSSSISSLHWRCSVNRKCSPSYQSVDPWAVCCPVHSSWTVRQKCRSSSADDVATETEEPFVFCPYILVLLQGERRARCVLACPLFFASGSESVGRTRSQPPPVVAPGEQTAAGHLYPGYSTGCCVALKFHHMVRFIQTVFNRYYIITRKFGGLWLLFYKRGIWVSIEYIEI